MGDRFSHMCVVRFTWLGCVGRVVVLCDDHVWLERVRERVVVGRSSSGSDGHSQVIAGSCITTM